MIIEDGNVKEIKISDIKPGQCFLYKNNIYMRIEPMVCNVGLDCNCINVETGLDKRFQENDIVEAIEAKLIFKREGKF